LVRASDTCITGVVPWPPRFLFISGRLALDFVHTGGEGERAHWERWHTARDLAEWMEACPMLAVKARVTDDDVAIARELREAIWTGAQAVLRGTPVAPALIDRVAAAPPLVPVLRKGDKAWASGSTGAQALSTVARDAIDLFGTAARERLRRCQNPRCALLFVDTSRPGKRAWCTMQRCGNLSKIARYRAGQRDDTSRKESP